MSERFFIPLDPAGFFEARPLPPHHAPSTPGLRFDPACLACACPTEARVTLRAGLRLPSGPVAWEQPVPLCPPCAAHQRAQEARRAWATWAALGAVLLGGVGVLVACKAWGLSPPIAVTLALALGLVAFWPARALASWASQRLLGPPPPAPTPGEVGLYFFRDPRQGEGAEFLCLEIGHPAQAEAFAQLNPHAIPSARWEELYDRARADGPPSHQG